MLDKFATKVGSLLRRSGPADACESRGLLGNQSVQSLDLYAEGQHDKHNLVYWIFFIYGVAMLLPWNVFITASEFFARRFAGTQYAETFQNYFSTYFTATNLFIFAILLWRQSNSSTFRVDVMSPVTLNAIVFGIMSITVETDTQGSGYFWFSLLLLVLTGATTSVFQVAVFAEACRFPSEYVQAVMSGQGIAGVAVAVTSILSAFAGSATEAPDEAAIRRSAFLYFMAALGITLMALIGRIIVVRQAFYKRQMEFESVDSSAIATSGLDDEEESIDDAQRFFADQDSKLSIVSVVKKSSALVFAVGYVFVITLALFPSITALIKSVSRYPPSAKSAANRFFDDDVFIAFHFVIFNVGDWIGRTMPIVEWLRTFKPNLLLLLSLSRTIFIPLFLWCNIVVSDRQLVTFIDSDLLYFVILSAFAVSNGWLGSLTMMAAPQQESITSSAEKSLVGSVMSFSLVLGLAIGGAMSFGIRAMV
ncbi:hypothetical protein VTP01DRAFT_612 [Rhizomucor pusillus]|uniref:uncharacterized protein n=1 Tax=Rhizomucor pusillus TaxID=4840 RepID=UPI0037425892